MLWKTEKLPKDTKGGWSSVSVADGRAYVFCNEKYSIPIETRTLSRKELSRLGWAPDMPADLRAKVKRARTSDARVGLERKKVRPWANNWVKKNVPKEMRKFRAHCQARLIAGKNAVPMETLDKVSAIEGRKFANEGAMREWMQGRNFDRRSIRVLLRVAPKSTPAAYDDIYCFSAATGKTLWKVRYPGKSTTYSSSCTPCIASGRCFVHGSDGNVYCLDAKTGAEIWRAKSKVRTSNTQASSFVVLGDVAVVLAGELMGLDARTGKVRWTQPKIKGDHASCAYWPKGGKTYLICNGAREVFCVVPETGEIIWSAPGGGDSTPAIVGRHMAVATNNKSLGLVVYELTADRPRERWRYAFTDRGTSAALHKEHVFVMGGLSKARAVCLNLATGNVVWQQKLTSTEFSSPVVADGKLLVPVGPGNKPGSLYMIDAEAEQFRLLGSPKLGVVTCTSVAIVDGKAFLRLQDGVGCYDLRK